MYFCLIVALCGAIPGIASGQANLQTTQSRRCLAPNREYGFCVHAARCPLPEFKTDKLRFMDYFCVIDRLYIGVCCTDKFLFQSQAGTTFVGNPDPLGHGNGQIKDSGQLFPVSEPTEAPKPKPVSSSEVTQRKGCGLNEKMEVGRVTGGRISDPKQWPWMAAIMVGNVQWCGGTLITERHVLTAAHCVHSLKPSQLTVRLGEHDFKRVDESRTQNINVSSMRIHKDFDLSTYENDITVLQLGRAALFNSYVWPVCLPEPGNTYVDKIAFVAGWGSMEFGGKGSDKLMEVSLPVWENQKCAKEYAQPIESYHICAGKDGKDSCQGDSGGPLLYQLENRRWVAIGVVSWGIRCGDPRPGIYTRVTSYLDWIVRNTI